MVNWVRVNRYYWMGEVPRVRSVEVFFNEGRGQWMAMAEPHEPTKTYSALAPSLAEAKVVAERLAKRLASSDDIEEAAVIRGQDRLAEAGQHQPTAG